jgi:hypothetical protein
MQLVVLLGVKIKTPFGVLLLNVPLHYQKISLDM